ncbi:MAG: GTPase Era, partial [Myxococcota bacterium]|nr:GTPase Era [Myxococcota bacterium]
WQAVYVDTPGIHEAKNLLHRYMVQLAVGTLADADLVYFLVDVAHFESKPDKVLEQTQAIVEALSQVGTPTFLVLNKVDHLKRKNALLPMMEQLGGLYPFAEVVPISALRGTGVDTLSDLTRSRLPVGPPLFPEDSLTDRSMRFIAGELVREQLYMRLRQELPYQVAVSVDHWEESDEVEAVKIYATIHVARETHKGMVIGKGAANLKAIGQNARLGIEAILERRIYLDLKVRVQDKWTNDPRALRKLGYDESP